MAENEVIYEKQGSVATLTFNRPQARNAMTYAMYEELYNTCERVDADDEIRVLVLRGAGEKAFVAGTDINQFRDLRTPADARAYEDRMDRVIGRLEAVRKPVIAAVRGYATGGGAMIALVSDLRICASDARFGIPVARTLGNVLSSANYARLLDLLGPSRTKYLIYSATMVDAAGALTMGLANEVVPPEHLEARVAELSETIAKHAPLTLQATKESIRRIQAHRRGPHNDDLVVACYTSEDFQEGVHAFLEKRPPEFKGR